MAGIDLFDKKEILKEYNFLSNNLKNIDNLEINGQLEIDNTYRTMTHKKMIELIRNNNYA